MTENELRKIVQLLISTSMYSTKNKLLRAAITKVKGKATDAEVSKIVDEIWN